MTLRELRESMKMTQSEFGKAIGVSQQSVAAYERGERRVLPERANRIAQEFNLSIEEIWAMFYDRPA